MNYLHFGNPPVLHRDLKSANILLDDSYNAKVADFGLSRLKAQERSMTGNCGTVQWMAPEILANKTYAEPADVYSYGKFSVEMYKCRITRFVFLFCACCTHSYIVNLSH
jgi:serine/threonine protein kinase